MAVSQAPSGQHHGRQQNVFANVMVANARCTIFLGRHRPPSQNGAADGTLHGHCEDAPPPARPALRGGSADCGWRTQSDAPSQEGLAIRAPPPSDVSEDAQTLGPSAVELAVAGLFAATPSRSASLSLSLSPVRVHVKHYKRQTVPAASGPGLYIRSFAACNFPAVNTWTDSAEMC